MLRLQIDDFAAYLEASGIVDFTQPAVACLASKLRDEASSRQELVKFTYEYVRDKINHSADIEAKVVTCKASEVLRAGEGLCYAKAHLLAALLRKNDIACGFCYQLLVSAVSGQLALHGLNAVYMEELDRWIRLDARGNKNGIAAQFSLTDERLAYQVREELGERDIKVVFAQPDKSVVDILAGSKDFAVLWLNLPNVLLW